MGALPTPDVKLFDDALFDDVVDNYFAIGKQMLHTHREFTKSVLAATTAAAAEAARAGHNAAQDSAR